jgi:hypothetical protein
LIGIVKGNFWCDLQVIELRSHPAAEMKNLPLPVPTLNQLATASDKQRASLLLEVMRQ